MYDVAVESPKPPPQFYELFSSEQSCPWFGEIATPQIPNHIISGFWELESLHIWQILDWERLLCIQAAEILEAIQLWLYQQHNFAKMKFLHNQLRSLQWHLSNINIAGCVLADYSPISPRLLLIMSKRRWLHSKDAGKLAIPFTVAYSFPFLTPPKAMHTASWNMPPASLLSPSSLFS